MSERQDPAVPAEGKCLTVRETADLLELHPNTVYELLRTKQLHGVRFGRAWRVPLDVLTRRLRYKSPA